jgi:hypothetical protein
VLDEFSRIVFQPIDVLFIGSRRPSGACADFSAEPFGVAYVIEQASTVDGAGAAQRTTAKFLACHSCEPIMIARAIAGPFG